MKIRVYISIFLIVYIIILIFLISKKYEFFKSQSTIPDSPFSIGQKISINYYEFSPNYYSPPVNSSPTIISSHSNSNRCLYYATIKSITPNGSYPNYSYTYELNYLDNVPSSLPKTFIDNLKHPFESYNPTSPTKFKAVSSTNHNFKIEDLFISDRREILVGCYLDKMKELQPKYQTQMLSASQGEGKATRGKYYAFFWDSIMSSLGNNLHQLNRQSKPIKLQYMGRGFAVHEIIANTFNTYSPPASILQFTLNYKDGSNLCPINSIYNPSTSSFIPGYACSSRQHIVGFVDNTNDYDSVFSISSTVNSTFETQVAGRQEVTLLKYTFDSLADKDLSLSTSIQDIMNNAHSLGRVFTYLRDLCLAVLVPMVQLNTPTTPQQINIPVVNLVYKSIIHLYTETYTKYTNIDISYQESLLPIETVKKTLADAINARANKKVISIGNKEASTSTLEKTINSIFAIPGIPHIPGWSETVTVPTSQLDYTTMQYQTSWDISKDGVTITTNPILNSQYDIHVIPLAGVDNSNKKVYKSSCQIIIKKKNRNKCKIGWDKLFQVYLNKNIIFAKIDDTGYITKLFTRPSKVQELEYSAESVSSIQNSLRSSLSSLDQSTIDEAVKMSTPNIRRASIKKTEITDSNVEDNITFSSLDGSSLTIPNSKTLSVEKNLSDGTESKEMYPCPSNALPNVCKNTLLQKERSSEDKKRAFLFIESKPTKTKVSELVNYLSTIDNMLIFRKHVKQLVITFREFENPVFRNRSQPASDDVYRDEMKFLLTMQLALHNLNDYYHIIAIDTKNPNASANSMYLTKPPDYFTASYKTKTGMLPIISTFSNMTVTYLRRETGLTITGNKTVDEWTKTPVLLVSPTIKRITPFIDKTNVNREAELKKIRESVLSGKKLGQLVWKY